jgi:hypothetical protein
MKAHEDERQAAEEAGYGAAEGSETPTGPPQVLPDPALQPGSPGSRPESSRSRPTRRNRGTSRRLPSRRHRGHPSCRRSPPSHARSLAHLCYTLCADSV